MNRNQWEVHGRTAPLLKTGGDAISHLVNCTSSSVFDRRERANTSTRVIPDLLTQCLIKANRFIATEQSWDAPVTATSPAMAKTAIGKTNLRVVFAHWTVFSIDAGWWMLRMLKDAEGCAQKSPMLEKQNKYASRIEGFAYYFSNTELSRIVFNDQI